MLQTLAQGSPDISGRLTAADVFSTACLLQQQLHILEERCRVDAEREARLQHTRAELDAIRSALATAETAEARATAELARTLARLRRADRTSITQSQSQSLAQSQVPFPFPARLQRSSLEIQTPTGSPKAARPASVPLALARQSMASPLARLLREALPRECSSPRRPARADAPSPTGSAGPSSPASRPGSPILGMGMTDAEAALARTLHAFFTSHRPPAPCSTPPAPTPADISLDEPETRLSLLDPSLRAVSLGTHVVTAARAEAHGDTPASPDPDPELGGDTSDADASSRASYARMSAGVVLSAALAGRFERATYVRMSALGDHVYPGRGLADRLGGHDIAPDDLRAGVRMERAPTPEMAPSMSLLQRLGEVRTSAAARRLKTAILGRRGSSTSRDTRPARPSKLRGKSAVLGGRLVSMGRRRPSGKAGSLRRASRSGGGKENRHEELQDSVGGTIPAASLKGVDGPSVTVEGVVAVAESG